jgi:glycosyltransferase involved in cell wall biosynthesis
MRIGLMLRSLDEKFGVGVYTRNILDALLRLDRKNEYVLFYKSKNHLGKYSHYSNVEEKILKASNKLYWDQVLVPLAARKSGVDVLFHVKFTVPLLTRCKTVMVVHGASWFVHPELYPNKVDLMYVKAMMPLYCRRADMIISNSNLTTADFANILRVPPRKIRTIYFGLDPIFQPIKDQSKLYEIKEKYDLPERFILTVSRYDPRKNFCTIFDAFTKCRDQSELKLIAVGRNSYRYKLDCDIVKRGYQNSVIFPGYVEQEDLPAFYNLAEAFLFPSVYEEFGIPLIEAMACGCPVVASNTGAIPEITGGAAFLCNPFDANIMAQGIDRISHDPDYRLELVKKGLLRSKEFSWEKCARETLSLLESLAGEKSDPTLQRVAGIPE